MEVGLFTKFQTHKAFRKHMHMQIQKKNSTYDPSQAKLNKRTRQQAQKKILKLTGYQFLC